MIFYMNNIAWKIEYVKPTNQYLKNSFGVYTLGCCDRNTQTIYISDRLRGNMLRRVLLHEICHSAMWSYNVEMSVEQEEMFCNLIATYGDEIIGIVDDIFRILSEAA